MPIVITGFEPLDLLEGVLRTRAAARSGPGRGREPVRPGRPAARATRSRGKLIDEVFEVCDRKWRGVGLIPQSGYRLRDEYRDHDAERLFEVDDIETQESSVCISGADPARAEEAARLPGVRQGMHAADAARGDDGLVRRGLRGLLRLRPAPGGGEPRARDGRDRSADSRRHRRWPTCDGPPTTSPALFGTCPLPQSRYDHILLGHGSGGR